MFDGSTSQSHPSQSHASGGSNSGDGGGPSDGSGRTSGSGSFGKSTSGSHHHHHYTHEERLAKAWRSMASSIVNAFQKAEKASNENTRESLKELDDSVVTFIRARMDLHRWISMVEANLQGKAQEREALENYVRSKPRLGKRKRDDVGEEALLSPTPQVATNDATASTIDATAPQLYANP